MDLRGRGCAHPFRRNQRICNMRVGDVRKVLGSRGKTRSWLSFWCLEFGWQRFFVGNAFGVFTFEYGWKSFFDGDGFAR
jgi:hypothetical protein